MRIAKSPEGTGRKPIRALLGWILAAFIVVVAVFGPPLTGQMLPGLVEFRQNVLMLDREFERSSIRNNPSALRTDTLVFDDLERGSRSTGSKMPFRGGVA